MQYDHSLYYSFIVCVSVPVCIVCVVVHEVQFVGFAMDSNVS